MIEKLKTIKLTFINGEREHSTTERTEAATTKKLWTRLTLSSSGA
jgi:hypothetical protein